MLALSRAGWGTWTAPHTCPEHGEQTSGPLLYERPWPNSQDRNYHFCSECLMALVLEYATGPELRDLGAPRGE